MINGERPDPEQLLAEARQGRDDRLGVLLELYRNYLHLLARTQIDLHLQGRVNPSDLVQETFLEAYRDFGQFRGRTEQEWLAWLRRILVHNLARLAEQHIKALKRNARREVSIDRIELAVLDQTSARFDAALVSPHSSPSEQAQRREEAAIVADRMARLPAHYRDVIVLRNLEGLSFDEVARRMGRTPGSVRVLWLRALERLRQTHGWGDIP
jgi:RNA polymerase sigma-70 factor (ECF subfamily)